MASAKAPTILAVHWVVKHVPLGQLLVPAARLRIELVFPSGPPASQFSELGLLDTGAPLSVVPFRFRQRGLAWKPLAAAQVTWLGIPCDLGSVDVKVSDPRSARLQGPYTILAKFPHREPPGGPIPFLLGLECLLTHRVAFALPPHPQDGTLQFP